MKQFCLLSLLFCLPLLTVQADPLPVGSVAPKLTAVDQEGSPVDLGALYSKGTTLVYFYPKAGSANCTKQACSLTNSFKSIQDRGITVIGVSSDKPDAQKKFHEKYELPFTLVSDTDHKVATAFGVSLMMFGWEKRESFLIRDGKIVWENPDVDADTHTADVLKAFDALPK